jgi:hypothetical protein
VLRPPNYDKALPLLRVASSGDAADREAAREQSVEDPIA